MKTMLGDEVFALERDQLRGLAYRMIGSVTDAEDVVQDAWLRWQSCEQSKVDNPKHFITRIVTNLCLDRLRVNKKNRALYVGSWLPEPSLDSFSAADSADPEHIQQVADDITVAFMLALERLTASERAAFILHDVFAYDFNELATIMDRSAASCRQLASRARKALQTDKPRFAATVDEGARLAHAFQDAVRDGDINALTELLSKDAVFISDGGGKVIAVPAPVIGGKNIATMLLGFAKFYRDKQDIRTTLTTINGLPGFILWDKTGPVQTLVLENSAEGRIDKIYVVRNPEKLQHLKD